MKGLNFTGMGMKARFRDAKVKARKASSDVGGFQIFGKSTRRLSKRTWGWSEPRNTGRR